MNYLSVLGKTVTALVLSGLASPILLNAADFGLDKGVSLLQEVAGLKSISTAVPVSFKLLFVPSS